MRKLSIGLVLAMALLIAVSAVAIADNWAFFVVEVGDDGRYDLETFSHSDMITPTTYDTEMGVLSGDVTSTYMRIDSQRFEVFNVEGGSYVFGGMTTLSNLEGGAELRGDLWDVNLAEEDGHHWIHWYKDFEYGPLNSAVHLEQLTHPDTSPEGSPLVRHTSNFLYDIGGTAHSTILDDEVDTFEEAVALVDFPVLMPEEFPDDIELHSGSLFNTELVDRFNMYYRGDSGSVEIMQTNESVTISQANIIMKDQDMRIMETTNVEGTTFWVIEYIVPTHSVYLFSTLSLEDTMSMVKSLR